MEAGEHDEERQIVPLNLGQQGLIDRELALFESLQGVSHVAEHRIGIRDDKKLKQRYYPRSPAMQQVIDTQVEELLRSVAIEPSRSPHSAPIVLVKKKAGDWRMFVDYRQLNAHSVPDAYPVPRINHILERLRQARYISTLDLKNGYWQIPMARDSRQYTAFTVPGRGLYQWKVMPFGLHSASATFQRALYSVIGAEMEPVAFAYLDDIIVISATEEQHFQPTTIVHTVTALLKKGRKWTWRPEQQTALDDIRRCLITAPVLGCPDFNQKFVLQTDASYVGLGAVLSQDIEGLEKVIAYASRRLTPAEHNYTTTEKECLAIVWAIRKMQCYLEGYRFEVITDHLALKWLNSIESPSGRIARWALELQQFQFDVRYRRGKLNVVADTLSRQPCEALQGAVELEDHR